MDKKSQTLFAVLLTLIVLTVSVSYYRFMILHDYIVKKQVDCDPVMESCFIWKCDLDTEDECTGNLDEDTWYFKIAQRNAKNIPDCDPSDETCTPFNCPVEGEELCTQILCTNENVGIYSSVYSCTSSDDFIIIEPESEIRSDEIISSEARMEELIEPIQL